MAKVFTDRCGQDRVRFTGGLSPDEMFAIYADSRSVIDEGGSLHRPITMRVFEATGSGAALNTDPAPGIELLYEPDTEFISLDPSSVLESLPATDVMALTAQAGNARALGIHTYDHRVDELFTILQNLVPLSRGTNEEPGDELGGQREGADFLTVVEGYAEIDSVACSDQGSVWFASSSYLVLSHREVAERHMTVDAVVIDDDSVVTTDQLGRAHRFVFSSGNHASTVATMLTNAGQTFVESNEADIHIFDFETSGYIVRDTP